MWAPTWADTLKKDLLKGYDPSIRPSQHYNVTTVETGFVDRDKQSCEHVL